MRQFLALTSVSFAVVTSYAPSQSLTAPAQQRSEALELEGWRNLQFGMTVEQALEDLPNTDWNPYSLNKCREEATTKGCFLAATEGDISLRPVSDIQFKPHLTFSAGNRLAHITLSYSRKNIRSFSCLRIFERAADGVASKYGQLSFVPAPRGKDIGWRHLLGRTSAGTQIAYGIRNDGTYVTEMLRTHRPADLPPDRSGALEHWERVAHVRLLSSYLTVNGVAHCDVSVTYQDATPSSKSHKDEF